MAASQHWTWKTAAITVVAVTTIANLHFHSSFSGMAYEHLHWSNLDQFTYAIKYILYVQLQYHQSGVPQGTPRIFVRNVKSLFLLLLIEGHMSDTKQQSLILPSCIISVDLGPPMNSENDFTVSTKILLLCF